MEEIQCLQVGHGKEASAGYAVTTDSCHNMSMHHLIAMQELSIIHHRIILPSTVPTLTAIKPHPSGTLILSNPNESISKHMEQLIICQFSSLATDLRIQIPQAVASSMAATFLSHFPSELEISSNTNGPTPVVLDDHHVHPTQYQELRALYGPNAKFLSREQAVAAQICADRKSDLLLVLPTGFSKSLIFMMCGVNDYE